MVDDSGTDPVKKCAQILREDETERKEISTIKNKSPFSEQFKIYTTTKILNLHNNQDTKSTQQPRY